MRRVLTIDGKEHDCDVTGEGGSLVVAIGASRFAVVVTAQDGGFSVTVDGRAIALPLSRADAERAAAGTPITVAAAGREVTLMSAAPVKKAAEKAGAHHHGDPGSLVAMMPGTIVKVLAQPGAHVAKGAVLLVLEAMKMENELRAPVDGVVEEVRAETGKAVQKGDVLVTIRPEAANG